jgi:hypothetical protein
VPCGRWQVSGDISTIKRDLIGYGYGYGYWHVGLFLSVMLPYFEGIASDSMRTARPVARRQAMAAIFRAKSKQNSVGLW